MSVQLVKEQEEAVEAVPLGHIEVKKVTPAELAALKAEEAAVPAAPRESAPSVVAVAKAEVPAPQRTPQSRDACLREASKSSTPAVLTGFAILAAFFGSVFIWLVWIPLRSDIHVPGEIVFKTKRQSVQHLEGGIVKEILVKDGDTVQAGQPLIRLESSQVLPLVNMLDEQNLAEVAYMARLDAESKDLSQIAFPRSLTVHSSNPAVAKVIQAENKLFAARRIAFDHQVQLLRLQIAELNASSRGTRERLASKDQEIASVREQLEANRALRKEGYVTNTVVLEQERTLAAHTGEREVVAAAIAADKQRASELEQRILSLRAERVQAAVNELKQSALRRIDQQERVRPLRDTLERQVIRAPIAGKVVGMKVATIGGVIMPRDSLMEIAPIGDRLVIEGKVRLEDISEVKVGQVADVNITGLHLLKRPDVKAHVTYISDDRLMSASSQGPQGYYAAQFDLDQKSLATLGGVQLKPGMTVNVNIATKPRTPITDMVDSIREHFSNALVTR